MMHLRRRKTVRWKKLTTVPYVDKCNLSSQDTEILYFQQNSTVPSEKSKTLLTNKSCL